MVVHSDIVNKTVHNKLVSTINTIDTSRFVLITEYSTAKSGLAKKIAETAKEYLILVDLLK